MALDISRLQASLKSNIEAQFGPPNPDDTYLTKYCLALATAIVQEITGHAEAQVIYNDGQYVDSTHINQDQVRTSTSGTIL